MGFHPMFSLISNKMTQIFKKMIKKEEIIHSKEFKSHRILKLLTDLKAGESFKVNSLQTLNLVRYVAYRNSIKIARRKLHPYGWRIFKI